jgi:hypothetical protein
MKQSTAARKIRAWPPHRAALTGGLMALAALALVLPAEAWAASAVSSNWAGYVVRPTGAKKLDSVSGTWTEPAVTCSAGRASYSAVWVGLGGYSEKAKGLEQIGTDSDCTAGGRAVYSSWVELLPAAPTALSLKVHPGDRITAAVTVAGHYATLGLRDLSTGERVSRTVRVTHEDVTTAEWIVEAPSACATSGSCRTLPLADFGLVAFTGATATIGSLTSPIAQGAWRTTALQLQSAGTGAGGPGGQRFAQQSLELATPSSTSSSSGAFTVAYSEASSEAGASEGPTLPGFSGGPPG